MIFFLAVLIGHGNDVGSMSFHHIFKDKHLIISVTVTKEKKLKSISLEVMKLSFYVIKCFLFPKYFHGNITCRLWGGSEAYVKVARNVQPGAPSRAPSCIAEARRFQPTFPRIHCSQSVT